MQSQDGSYRERHLMNQAFPHAPTCRNRASSFQFRLQKLRVRALDRITKKLKVFPKNELIERFLEILGMRKKYSLIFRRYRLTLPFVTDENLKILGLKMGPRTVILNAAKYL